MAQNDLSIVITAKDQASKALSNVSGNISQLNDAAGRGVAPVNNLSNGSAIFAAKTVLAGVAA
ncbi:hypothetical protein, partial [Streptobacillus moniliformis]|uniref:hypothetical protein n=1 Tax=Streptobacillus moniliformis TaxID=34105 RepID=UPI001E3050AB